MTKTLKEVMLEQYRNTFIEILRSQFRSHPELSVTYFGLSRSRQRDIDNEIIKISDKMSEALVSKLGEQGHLEVEPSEEEFKELICQVLKEFGVEYEQSDNHAWI